MLSFQTFQEKPVYFLIISGVCITLYAKQIKTKSLEEENKFLNENAEYDSNDYPGKIINII
jgi:hypothetical protein